MGGRGIGGRRCCDLSDPASASKLGWSWVAFLNFFFDLFFTLVSPPGASRAFQPVLGWVTKNFITFHLMLFHLIIPCITNSFHLINHQLLCVCLFEGLETPELSRGLRTNDSAGFQTFNKSKVKLIFFFFYSF